VRTLRWNIVIPAVAAVVLAVTWGSKPGTAVLVVVGVLLAGSVPRHDPGGRSAPRAVRGVPLPGRLSVAGCDAVTMEAQPDQWSRWLLDRRDAGDPRQRSIALEHLAPIRDRVLVNAVPLDGVTLLDVGAGEGLIGLEALERVGPEGEVIFSDVSSALVERCREAVRARGSLERARFAVARAEDLDGIADESVDVVTTRSVLIYVAEKADAFAAFHRVLRPGGRISLFEPINRLTFPEPPGRFWGYDVAAVAELAGKVRAAFEYLHDPASVTMTDFDAADLVRLAEEAGFERVHCECHIDVQPGHPPQAADLETLLDTSPNPLAPTIREAIAEALSEPERERFVAHLRRAHDERRQVMRLAVAYLAAAKAG
jgi:arsenite methyltransferase